MGAATWLKEIPVVFEARLEPMIGRVRASLSEGGSGVSSGVVFGACQGLGSTWWMSDWLGLTLGAELSETTRRTVLRASLDGGSIHPIAVIPQVGWSMGIGVRLGVR